MTQIDTYESLNESPRDDVFIPNTDSLRRGSENEDLNGTAVHLKLKQPEPMY
jgi:hypothetical protein